MYKQSEFIKKNNINPIENAPVAELVGKRYEGGPTTWVWILVGLDSLTVSGVGVWIYFCYFHKKKKDKIRQ